VVLSDTEVKKLQELVGRALKELYRADISLIERRSKEPGIVFRFGLYFNTLVWLSGYRHLNVDAEYGKNGVVAKRVRRREANNEGALVYPDLILHQREHNRLNHLVLEFKGHWNKEDRYDDIYKIEQFTDQKTQEPYNYQYGLGGLVEMRKDNIVEVSYYVDKTPHSSFVYDFGKHSRL
jgi:hypothetical protein